ncbi:hypothetical protein NOF04DRAFT_1197183, partial [Fusarium oxysporum II5]
MLDAEHIEIGSNISTLTEEDAQAAADSCTKICETIYVGGRQDRSPSSPTREAESIHVAGYEVDANPLLDENGMADPELDPAMLDTQNGESVSNDQVADTMEGVEHGAVEANPLMGRAGSNNHTEGESSVQKTIAGTAKVVEQIEATASTGTGPEAGNISLPDPYDELDQQEMGVHLKNGILDNGNRNCSTQRDQTFAAKATNQESYMNQTGLGQDGVEAHTPPETDGTHFVKTSNLKTKNIDSLSGGMAVTFTSINRVVDTPFGFLTTAEGITNPFSNTKITTAIQMTMEKETDHNNMHGEDRRGKRLRETSTNESRTKPKTGEEVPTRKRRRVEENLPEPKGQRPAELDGIGVLCSVNPSTRKVETDKQNSDTHVQE